MACGIATLDDTIGLHQKAERSWSERYVTFGEDRSIAFLVATSPSILLPKRDFALDQFWTPFGDTCA
jgi:hypothetical protein